MVQKQEIIVRQPPLAKSKEEVFCDIFSYEPELVTEKALGDFYLLSQQSVKKDDFSSLPNLINSSLKRNFYKKPELGSLGSLKFALSQTNNVLRQDFLKNQSFDFANLFYLVVVVKKNQVHLAVSGQNVAFLYADDKIQDLNQKMVPPPQKQSPEKFFESLISIDLEPNNKLFLATPNLQKIISPEGLLQVAQEKRLSSSAEKINKLIREQKNPAPLALFMLKRLGQKKTSGKKRGQEEYITPPINLWEIVN